MSKDLIFLAGTLRESFPVCRRSKTLGIVQHTKVSPHSLPLIEVYFVVIMFRLTFVLVCYFNIDIIISKTPVL